MTSTHSNGTADQLLREITEALGYLRIGVFRDTTETEHDWYRSSDLLDTDRDGLLVSLVRTTGSARGIERDDIALSLFLQAYGFRIASTAIAGWILSGGDHYLDVPLTGTRIALGRNRPNAVALDQPELGADPISKRLFTDHLEPVVEAAHEAINRLGTNRVGKKMLWGNIGAGVASTFGVFSAIVEQDSSKADQVPDAEAVRGSAAEFMADAPIEIRSSGQFVLFQGKRVEPVWAWERSSCCLWYQVPPSNPDNDPFKCADCSLWTVEERTARYTAATGVIL